MKVRPAKLQKMHTVYLLLFLYALGEKNTTNSKAVIKNTWEKKTKSKKIQNNTNYMHTACLKNPTKTFKSSWYKYHQKVTKNWKIYKCYVRKIKKRNHVTKKDIK